VPSRSEVTPVEVGISDAGSSPQAVDLSTIEVRDLPPAPALPVGYSGRIRADYSQFRAAQTILFDGVPAYGAGAPVPASHPLVTDPVTGGPGEWVRDGLVVPVED